LTLESPIARVFESQQLPPPVEGPRPAGEDPKTPHGHFGISLRDKGNSRRLARGPIKIKTEPLIDIWKVESMGGIKKFVLKWVLPTDEETLRDWLFIIELFNILISLFMLLLLVLMIYANDFLWTIKFGVLLIMFVIGLSTLNVMQYLLAIEFNTRSRYIFKRRK
jgi:hypothetical protein